MIRGKKVVVRLVVMLLLCFVVCPGRLVIRCYMPYDFPFCPLRFASARDVPAFAKAFSYALWCASVWLCCFSILCAAAIKAQQE